MECVQPVIYIKHPKYIGDWMYYKTNSDRNGPIVLPHNTDLQEFLARHVIENVYNERRRTKSSNGFEKDTVSYSQEAYDFVAGCAQPPVIFDDLKVPKQSELPYLFPYQLPLAVIRNGKAVNTNKKYDLSAKAACVFRAEVSKMFWIALSSFIVGTENEAYREGIQYNRSVSIEKWFISRDMNLDNLESCIHQYAVLYKQNKLFKRDM